MRWPFTNWLRGAAGKDGPSPGASEAARAAADPDPGPVPDREPRPAAWRDLPPVQRVVGAAPLTAPSAEFARDLAGRRAPDPMLAPLGHDVTADGPAGLVSGIAVPLVQRAASVSGMRLSPALPAPAAPARGHPGAQRAATSVATWLPNDTVESAAGDASPVKASTDALAPSAPAVPAPDLPGLAPRILPAVSLATAMPALAATRVTDATAPAPVLALARIVASGTSLAPSRATLAASGPLPGTPGEPSGTLEPRSAAAIGPDRAAETGPAPDIPPESGVIAPPAVSRGDDPAHPVVSRRTLGESRRLGLGAPLVGPPPSASRETGRHDLPVARLARPTDAAGLAPARAPIEPAVPPAAAASMPLPRLVVARRSTTAPAAAPGLANVLPGELPAAHPVAADMAGDAPADAVGESVAVDAATSTRPLVGDSPLGVSRLAREGAAADADAGGAADPGGPTLQLAGGPITGGSGAVPADASPATGPEAGPAMPAGGQPSHPAGRFPVTRAPSSVAPLVAGRVMRTSGAATIGPATLGPALTAEPAPVVARLAVPSLGTRGGGGQASPAPDGGAASPGSAASLSAPSAPRVVARVEERPVVARAALGGGRGPSSPAPAPFPALPLARAAVGTPVPDAVESGRPGGAIGWAAATGFTSVAPSPGPFVQRAVTIDEVTTTPGEAAGPAESGATTGQAGQPGASGAAGPGTDYEELAEHLYDRIRARLTTELLLDRERAGALVDA